MRWKLNDKIPIGGHRRIRVFLWLPRENDGEIRWLEWAQIDQVYRIGCGWKSPQILGWFDERWAE